jgi:hypothetical protein
MAHLDAFDARLGVVLARPHARACALRVRRLSAPLQRVR